MQIPSTDCLKTPNELFWENNLLDSPERFKDCFNAEEDPDRKVALQKWHICHLILASDYKFLSREIKVLLTLRDQYPLSDASHGDIKYCEALKNFYQGFFQAAINDFFPAGEKNLFEYHVGDDYQMAHDHLLLGKAYLKMSYFTRAYFHFYQAIHYFAKKDPESIWIPKVLGLIAVAYFQEEKFEQGVFFTNLSIEKLKKTLGEDYSDHHVYGSLCTDLGIGYLAQGKNEPDPKEREDLYEAAETYLARGNDIFKKIYQGTDNRYNALIFKNFGVLAKRQATESASAKDAIGLYKEAMNFLKKDLDIRKKLFKDSNKKGIPHHTTLGDTCNIIAKLKLQQADKTEDQTIKKNILLESIHYTNMAMHYVVEGYIYEDNNATNHDLGILKHSITQTKVNKLNEANEPDLTHIQSYFYLLLAFHLKLKALKRLLTIVSADHHKAIKDEFYSIIKICSTFISNVRERYQYDLANFALNKITRPLFESILSFLYIEYKLQENNGTVSDELLQTILDTLESSKNYDIVQAIERDEIHIEQGDQVILDLFKKFQACIQKDDRFSKDEEEKAISFLSDQHPKISELCQKLRIQDKKRSEVHDAIEKRVDLIVVKERMKDLASKINEGQNDQDTSIISFFYGKKEIFAFTINSKDCGFFKLKIGPIELKQQIKKLVDVMKQSDMQRHAAEYRSWLFNNQLYKKLIGNLNIPEDVRFLIFIPDQELDQLPFDILPLEVSDDTPQPKVKYLIQKYYTSYHYSISMLYHSVNPDAPETQYAPPQWTINYLGISSNYSQKPEEDKKISSNGKDTSPTTDLNLEVTNTGLQMIKAGVASESVRCYVEKIKPQLPDYLIVDDLSQPRIINKNLCHTQILHFATHGTPDMKVIKLSEQYKIGLEEINNTKNISLVILHGCDTGRNESPGKRSASKSLGRLFLAKKGIRNVIYSVTTVTNSQYDTLSVEAKDSSFDLIEKFFELLLENSHPEKQEKVMTYPVALSKAKAEILSREEYNFFPPFVAGLIFVGCPTDFFSIQTPKKNS